jgi:radical SAM protein with 4Fe4S-binding SPASM domain
MPSLQPVCWELEQVFSLASQCSVRHITISGGEPLMYNNLVWLLETVAKIADTVSLTTNGSLLTTNRVAEIEAYVDRIEISLEGPTPEAHDSCRSPGSFESVVSAMQSIHTSSLTTAAITTITKRNLHLLEPIIQTSIALGFDMIGVNAVIPTGSALSNSFLLLSPSEKYRLYYELYKLRAKYCAEIIILSEDPLFNVIAQVDCSDSWAGCVAGYSLMVNASGDVFPCSLLPVPLANIRDTNLLEKLHESQVLNSLRSRALLQKPCRTCQHIQICGGCRAAALGLKHALMEADPTCWMLTVTKNHD